MPWLFYDLSIGMATRPAHLYLLFIKFLVVLPSPSFLNHFNYLHIFFQLLYFPCFFYGPSLFWMILMEYVHQGCILSPCLFNLYAEYIMRNAGLEETQAGIKIAGRNINNLSYADDTILMAESEEELKSLLMKVKMESEKVGLKLNIQKMKIMASGPITSWEIDGETASDLIFLGSKITADGDCSHEIKRCRSEERRVGKECRSRWSPYH